MKIGALMFATDYSMTASELAVAMEDRGFESLFFPEHSHIPASRLSPWPGGAELPPEYSHSHDPFVALSFAAAVTKHLLIGTGICLLPQRDTIQTAKLVASIDHLSNGRFIFGIGGGWNKEEMAHHGVDYPQRFAKMKEQVEAMKGLWNNHEFGFNGDHVNFSPSWAYPKPSQQPNPPVLLGGETDYTLNRIVDYCDGWLPRARGGFNPAKEMSRLHNIAKEKGRDINTLTVSLFGATPKHEILAECAEAGMTRAILPLPSADADTIMPLLDKYADLMRSVN